MAHCSEYVYLGSVFLEEGNFADFMTAHVKAKNKHFYKFLNFVRNNRDAPLQVKRKVFDACLKSTLIYGCESWFYANLSELQTLYMSAIKCMLHVRTTAPNDLCLLELDMPSLKAVVKDRQTKFYKRIVEARREMDDDPFNFAIALARENNLKCWQLIRSIMDDETNVISNDIECRKRSVNQSQGSKFKTYCELNPDLSGHPVYSDKDIPDYQRVSFTRLRISSHSLKVETGRWSRTPRENRTCPCNDTSVQDEKHVITECELYAELRARFPNVTFEIPAFFNCDPKAISVICHEILKPKDNT